MIMNILNDDILNKMIAKLLNKGVAEFDKDGLNIKASFDDGCLKIEAEFVSPEEDTVEENVEENVEEYVNTFEDYIKSLSDEFFLETVETFEKGELKQIQDKLDSNKLELVTKGINEFMARLKTVASNKIKEINADIELEEKKLSELIEIRDSYIHVLNKKF